MSLKRILLIAAVVGMIGVLTITLAVIAMNILDTRHSLESRNSNEAVRKITFLLTLLQEPLDTPNQRAFLQWQSQHADLLSALERLQTPEEQSRRLKNRIIHEHFAVGFLHERLVGSDHGSPTPETMRMIRGQLLVRTASMVNDILAIDELTDEHNNRTQRWMLAGLTGSAAFLGGVIGLLLYFLHRKVVTPVVTLEKAAQTLSEGRLDQPILMSGRDEVALLAASFERMRVSLRGRMDDLVDAKKQVEKANQAKSDFLANMSHEIRTPMNGVLGLTDLILLENIPPRAREYLLLVRQSGLNLLAIINDILDLAKIESGRVELEQRQFDLDEVLESTLGLLAVGAADKGLQLIHAMESGVPCRLVGDQGRLRQILINIIGNAIKYTAHGQINVSVGLRESIAPERVRLLFSVKDTGAGISSDRLRQGLANFAQVGSSAHARYGGAGLGLSISKSLVEMMGGEIWVESEIGHGSTFFFTAAFGLTGELEQPRAAPSPDVPSSSGNLRVLVVEDDMVNRLLVVTLLQQRGHRVVQAGNGLEAIEALKAECFDLVLMDVRMPVMGGEDAVRAIRNGEAGSDKAGTRIVALTAHALKGDRERFLAAGMDGYMSKPLDLRELDRVLADTMGTNAA